MKPRLTDVANIRSMSSREFQECLDKAGGYSGDEARMKTGNLHRDVVIRRLINLDLKIISHLNQKK